MELARTNENVNLTATVYDVKFLNYTVNNIIEFVEGLPMNDLDDFLNNYMDYNIVPQNRALYNALNGIDFNALTHSDLDDIKALIKVTGLDNRDNYTVLEYAYIYQRLVVAFENF